MKPKLLFPALLMGLLLFSSCRSREGWNEIFKKKGGDYLNKSRYEEALTEFEKAHRILPSDQKVFLLKAEAFYQLKKWGPALECLNSYAVQSQDMPAKYFFMRAQMILRVNGLDLAAFGLGFNPAIERDPQNGAYYYGRGKAYLQFGNKESAAQDFETARRLGYLAGDSQ